MLLIHRAERADALVAVLAQVLANPSGDPFQREVVAVPSRGTERWLAQRLSHVLGATAAGNDGVCANVEFPSYTRVLDETVAAADPDYAHAVELWRPGRSVWPLMQVIDRCAPTEDWCAVLAAHLGLVTGSGVDGADGISAGSTDSTGDADRGRRFAVASKIAYLFDRYGRARPEMIRAWQTGYDPDEPDLRWQAELWRRLRGELGPAPAELLDVACAQIGAGTDFSVFGATRISPTRITVLGALAATRDVHLWLPHPSPALWAAVAQLGERPGRRADQRPVARNPLLAAMSRDVRELQQLLTTAPHHDEHHEIAHTDATLLGRLQAELARDHRPVSPTPIALQDHSVQIHAAHGPARQVEVVREALLTLFSQDTTLEPRDVVIMCPDVEGFAPLVAASFGMADEPGAHPAARLRVKFADRSLRQTNPLLKLLSQLLDLAGSRVTATAVLDLAGAPPVRRRFGFDDDDVERLRDWTVSTGARWGLDAQHRGRYQLSSIAQGTWRAAIDRMLVGVTMEDDLGWVGDTLPLDDVDSGDIELAGRFAELVDRVEHIVGRLAVPMTVPQWCQVLVTAVDALGEGDETWQLMALRRELDDVAQDAGDTDTVLGLTDVAALLDARLAGRPTRAGFRTGTLTVCTLVPMRSVPHRVVCLLGMDDGAFPRQAIADGDDILARVPRTGERDPRSEDRQLFLDAICAAQEHLVIAYTGSDPRSGMPVAPCVPLAELLDALDATACAPGGGPARDHVVIHHPLQPFDRRNFIAGELGGPGPFSYDPSGLAGARASIRPRTPEPPLLAHPLAPLATQTVGLDDLVRFFAHPVRGFLRQRLDISTAATDEDPDDALTIELDGLQSWAIGERVLRRSLAGAAAATIAHLEGLRGQLPPGPLGRTAWRTIGVRVDALLRACEAERRHRATSIDIAVDLPGGRLLVGTVGGVRRGADTTVVLSVSYSSLAARHRLGAWIRYLAVVAATADADVRAVTVGRRSNNAQRSVLHGVDGPQARELLGELVEIRDAGLREPLPLALATSAAYAERRHRRVNVANALATARLSWETDRFAPERDEREHVLAFGTQAPLERLTAAAGGDAEEPSRFGELARRLWTPLLEAEGEVRA